MMGERAKTVLDPKDQMVKVGEGWVYLESVLLASCRVAK
jgi:hypothetical protein